MSQTQLAHETGISRQRIQQYCSGKHIPSVIDGNKIAKALNTKIEYIFQGEGENLT